MFELDDTKEKVVASDEPTCVEIVKNSLTIREGESKDSSSSSNDSKDSNKK